MKKINFCVAGVMIAVSSFMQIWRNDQIYYGISFNYTFFELIFCALYFITLSTLLKNRENCLFSDNNIVSLTRFSSRRRAIAVEIKKIIIIVLNMEIIGDIVTYLSYLILDEKILIKQLFLFFALKFLTLLFIMILQFIIEIYVAHNTSFLAICVAFLFLLIIGSGIYRYNLENPASEFVPLLRQINKLNLVNYISLERAQELVDNIRNVILAFVILLIVEISILFLKIKKLNILPKE